MENVVDEKKFVQHNNRSIDAVIRKGLWVAA